MYAVMIPGLDMNSGFERIPGEQFYMFRIYLV